MIAKTRPIILRSNNGGLCIFLYAESSGMLRPTKTMPPYRKDVPMLPPAMWRGCVKLEKIKRQELYSEHMAGLVKICTCKVTAESRAPHVLGGFRVQPRLLWQRSPNSPFPAVPIVGAAQYTHETGASRLKPCLGGGELCGAVTHTVPTRRGRSCSPELLMLLLLLLTQIFGPLLSPFLGLFLSFFRL